MPSIGALTAVTKQAAQGLLDARFHARHYLQARRILRDRRSLASDLPPHLKRQADEYAADILGWRGYAPWLRVYAAVARTFKEGWIPDNYYGRVVVPSVNGAHGRLSSTKTLSAIFFDEALLPDLAYAINGRLYNAAFELIGAEPLRETLFAKSDTIVFKRNDSKQGRGVTVLHREDPLPPDRPDGVFQRYIHQHSALKAMSPTAVATLRLTTVAGPDRTVSVRAAYLRVGRIGESHVQSSSHIRIALDASSGTFDDRVFLPTWAVTDRHPDSGFVFANQSPPGYSECCNAAISLHKRISFVQCVGWDFAIDTEGRPVLMEWNGGHNDIKFSEATTGPCFAGLGWENLWRAPSATSDAPSRGS